MTTYAATGQASYPSSGDWAPRSIAIMPTTYEILIGDIELWCLDNWGTYGISTISRVANASVSGGSAGTSIPLRQGGPASTVTTRVGSLSISGATSQLLSTTEGLSVQHKFSYDLVVSPGSAFVFTYKGISKADKDTWPQLFVVYFEELRLSWPY